jgi:hypothetical protein
MSAEVGFRASRGGTGRALNQRAQDGLFAVWHARLGEPGQRRLAGPAAISESIFSDSSALRRHFRVVCAAWRVALTPGSCGELRRVPSRAEIYQSAFVKAAIECPRVIEPAQALRSLNDYKVFRVLSCAQAAYLGIIRQVYTLFLLNQFQFLTDEL